MVEFQEDNDPLTTGNGKFNLSFPTKKIIDPPPHDKKYFMAHLQFLKNYFSKFSINIEYEIIDSIFTLPKQMRHYSPPQDSGLERILMLVYDTWKIVKNSRIRTIYPLSSYDCYIIFHAGVGRDINLSAEYGYNPTPFDIPSLFVNQDSIIEFLRKKGITENFEIKNSIILPETESRYIQSITGERLLQIGLNGLLVSNFASFLGLPDLFDTKTGRSRIGRFGLMDGAGIFSYRGLLPPEPSAWEKLKLGICQPVEVRNFKDTTISISSFQVNKNNAIYKIPINAKEYFLIENRNRDAFNDGVKLKFYWRDSTGERIIERVFTRDQTGFNYFDVDSVYGVLIDVDEPDWALPGSGILIWYIDENVIDENLKTNSINNDVKRLGVKLVEADGPQVIFGDEIGWEFDMWFLGNPAPTYKNEFSINAYPWNPTNKLSNFNFKIYDFSLPSPSMTFKLGISDSLILSVSAFPKRTPGLSKISFITTANIDNDPQSEIILNSSVGIFAFNLNGSSLTLNESGYYSNIKSDFACAVFDVDDDGIGDVIGVDGRKVFVLKKDDSNFDSFADVVWSFSNEVSISTPPAVYQSKIAFGDSAGNFIILNKSGTLNKKIKISDDPIVSLIVSDSMWVAVSKKKIRTETSEWNFNVNFVSSAGIDLKRNGLIEIVVGLSETGDVVILNTLTGEVKQLKIHPSPKTYSSPALADLNLDGLPDIVITSGNKIWAFDHFGSVLVNFPIEVKNVNSLSSPVIVNFSGDTLPEIIVGTDVGLIYAFDVYGKTVSMFPISVSNACFSSPAVYYESNMIYLFVPSMDGYLYSWLVKANTYPVNIQWASYLRDERHSNYSSRLFEIVSVPSGKILDDKVVYNWPNPVYDDFTYIRVKTFKDARVNVKIFDLAGFKVDEINTITNANFESDIKWSVKNLQPGIYYARVEAVADGRSEVKIIKIAVLR
ncbi:MAG: T9SS type A sorting domain-containing protein [Candidatus Kryptonium sp.]